eukprot:12308538-Alexandrium_andersonii.AAC.1
MSASLVGSEMCIRDRIDVPWGKLAWAGATPMATRTGSRDRCKEPRATTSGVCLGAPTPTRRRSRN